MARKSPHRGRIDVVVRKRPLNALELSRGERDIVVCNHDTGTIREFKCKIDGTNFIEEHEFRVDRFYDETADNALIYGDYVKPLVELAFREGKTCSCFTYGQTGSGKTFTMIGSRAPGGCGDSDKVVAGIYEYAANDIYRILKEPEFEGKIEVVISFYEIYCGKLYDLLQKRKLLESLENGRREVVIKDLSVRRVASREELVEHMLEGLNLRRIGQNSQNDHSSRSHALLRIELKARETARTHGRSPARAGSILFVDLAGSERGADSFSSSKQTQIDGAGINRSLLALKECIRAMDLEKLHVPFRNSELTKVLRDVFVGDSRSVMIANVCPSGQSCEQTLNTLRYASKVKNFRVNAGGGGLGSFGTLESPLGSAGSKSYSRFVSLPAPKLDSSLLSFFKTPPSRKFADEPVPATPTPSPLDRALGSGVERMDLDPVVRAVASSFERSPSGPFPALDRIEGVLKSQSLAARAGLDAILDSVELSEPNKAIYRHLTSGGALGAPDEEGAAASGGGGGSRDSPPPPAAPDALLRAYRTYCRVSSLFRALEPGDDPVDSIRARFRIELRLLLGLSQLLGPGCSDA